MIQSVLSSARVTREEIEVVGMRGFDVAREVIRPYTVTLAHRSAKPHRV